MCTESEIQTKLREIERREQPEDNEHVRGAEGVRMCFVASRSWTQDAGTQTRGMNSKTQLYLLTGEKHIKLNYPGKI